MSKVSLTFLGDDVTLFQGSQIILPGIKSWAIYNYVGVCPDILLLTHISVG